MKMKFEKGHFDELEKIRIYMEYHPEVFTEDLMEYLADTYLNYNTVRNRIKALYPSIVSDLVKNKQIHVIPDDYEKLFKEKNEQ
jgi:hypothetical protein